MSTLCSPCDSSHDNMPISTETLLRGVILVLLFLVNVTSYPLRTRQVVYLTTYKPHSNITSYFSSSNDEADITAYPTSNDETISNNQAHNGERTNVTTHPVGADVMHTTCFQSTNGEFEDLKRMTDSDTVVLTTQCPQMCVCRHYYANCSSHYGRLTYIPQMPFDITHLIFSRNNLTAIHTDAFFANVTNITYLDLSCNGLNFISSGAFTAFTRLNTLILDNNIASNHMLHLVAAIKTLTIFSLNATHLRPLSNDTFCLRSQQHTIYLYKNKFTELNFVNFVQCIHLRYLDLGHNYIRDIIPLRMSSLQTLSLHHNYIVHFPKTCLEGNSLFPNLTYLNLSVNDIHTFHNVCLPNLMILDLSFNRFSRFTSNMFLSFPKLLHLDLKNTIGTGKMVVFEKNAFSSPTLKSISLIKSRISFRNDDRVHPYVFAHCPNLTEIQLDDNFFTGVMEDKFHKLFGHLTSLRNLFLGYNQIIIITQIMFKGLPAIEKLYLYGNLIVSIPDGTFDYMTHLHVLHLGGNKLSVIGKTTFNESTQNRLIWLDISANPFECSCDAMWFRNWLLSNKSLFYKAPEGYRCKTTNLSLADFYLPEQACILSSDAFTFTVVSVSLVLITLTVTAVFYWLRWHIRLLLYEAFRGRTGERRLHYLMTGNFPYDVFVSYSAEDLDWVREHLMPELEERMGLRLCIHHRDFMPGRNILDSIAEGLEKSKKVMLIFSTHFARSQWCQFELALCLEHVMNHDDILVIVCLEDLPIRIFTSAMLAVLKITTYIQWEDDDEDARESFWNRIRTAFHEIRSLK